ncbi:MAG: T9SS type A sorting domain-containing protein [Bacteroidia bacterium]|nr:T9SS type A sorting domain-containing protein [Bacteroidia bacterium]
MKYTCFILFIFYAFTGHVKAQCSPAAANIYSFTYNGNLYEIVKEKLNWVNAAACAVTRGGKLAEIETKAEQDTLFNNIKKAGIIAANTVAPDGGGASYLWLGATDFLVEGKWVWDGDNNGIAIQFWQGTKTGSAVAGRYNNWGNEPDNFNSQNCLALAYTNWPLGVAGQWNDVKETNLLYYVIEHSATTSIVEMIPELVSIYPNPAVETLTINVSEKLVSSAYTITDCTGKKMLTGSLTESHNLIDVSNLFKGVYFLMLDKNSSKSIKFVK